MATDLTCTAQNPFVFLVSGEVNDAMEIVADLRPAAMAAAGGALLAEENLGDLDDVATARTNLGGTATGVAVFTAVNATAARTATSAMSRSMTDAAGVAAALIDAADDAAAALAGVAVGAVYRTGSILKTRVA